MCGGRLVAREFTSFGCVKYKFLAECVPLSRVLFAWGELPHRRKQAGRNRLSLCRVQPTPFFGRVACRKSPQNPNIWGFCGLPNRCLGTMVGVGFAGHWMKPLSDLLRCIHPPSSSPYRASNHKGATDLLYPKFYFRTCFNT